MDKEIKVFSAGYVITSIGIILYSIQTNVIANTLLKFLSATTLSIGMLLLIVHVVQIYKRK